MKFGLSLFSKMRSFIGFEIGHGGYLKRDSDGMPIMVRTIELSFGFIFGWFTLGFNHGGQIRLDEINEKLREAVINGKKIGTNE